MTDPLRAAFEQGLAKLPEALRALTRPPVAAIAAQLAGLPVSAQGENWPDVAPRVLAVSEFVARACETRPGLLPDLIQSGDLFCAYASDELRRRVQTATADCADESSLKRVLRKLRQRELVRLAWRDLAGWANLEEVVRTLSALADACLGAALAKLYSWAVERDGVPREQGTDTAARFIVLGMGKLGG